MTCEEYQEWISAELDLELDKGDEARLWVHLSECELCRGWRRDQQQIRRDFQLWPEEALPKSIKPPEAASAAGERSTYRIPRALAWAAGVIIVAQGAYLFVGSHEGVVLDNGEGDEVETIELTSQDRTSHSLEQFYLVGSPVEEK